MSDIPYRLRTVALTLVVALILIFAFAPSPVVELLHALTNLWSLGLMAAAAGTLLWFVYRVLLRRWWRVRRIANLRLRRMLEESASDRRDPRT